MTGRMGVWGPSVQVDFFISYTAAHRAWAEWIAWQLESERYPTVLQAWDMVPGPDLIHETQKAASTAKHTLAVLSAAYFTSQFAEAEWRVAFANDPSGERRRLIPVRTHSRNSRRAVDVSRERSRQHSSSRMGLVDAPALQSRRNARTLHQP